MLDQAGQLAYAVSRLGVGGGCGITWSKGIFILFSHTSHLCGVTQICTSEIVDANPSGLCKDGNCNLA